MNILSGFVNAFIYPAAAALLGHWAPPHDRTLLATIVYAGCGLGIALGQPVAGYISDSSLSTFHICYIYLAWKGVYYIYSSFIVIVFIIYIMYSNVYLI